MKLSNLKIGDTILLKKSKNYGNAWNGTLVKIIDRGGNYYVCSSINGKPTNGHINVYFSGGAIDEFCLANRKEQANFLIEKSNTMREELVEIEKEINFLEKYETEEDYVAEKLEKILKAKDKHSIAKILKELKKSDYI